MCSRRSDRVRKVAKREESAYHLSGRGKLNIDHGVGRMSRSGKRYERGQQAELPPYRRWALFLFYDDEVGCNAEVPYVEVIPCP
jgi:hypothetical protein